MSKFLDVLDKLNEAEVNWIKGSELSPELQKEVKARYIYRYTGNNKPQWAKETWKDGKPYPLHFKDDKDWLENTKFAVTKKGKLCNKTKYCQSSPSFPNDPELRKNIKECVMEESKPLAILEGRDLPAFKITYDDGSTNTTSMAKGVTLDDAKK